MTRARRAILLGYLVGVAFLCLWVPWRAVVASVPDVWVYAGYGPLWKGPTLPRVLEAERRNLLQRAAIVDRDRWLGTVLALSATAGIGLILARNPKS